uniref:Uncharacterized protein n=1 Tax=Ditylenchus dipsaci TaxID=166011 RepID=A0A915DKQ5_9BILA
MVSKSSTTATMAVMLYESAGKSKRYLARTICCLYKKRIEPLMFEFRWKESNQGAACKLNWQVARKNCNDLATEIEDESQRMLHYQEVQFGYAVMSEKKVPGTVCSNGLMLNTNVYGLRTSKVLVYCYNVKVIGVTQTGTLFDFTEVGHTDFFVLKRLSAEESFQTSSLN